MKRIYNLTNWDFRIDSIDFQKQITLPHTWNVDNNTDVQLYRGECAYNTSVSLEDAENQTVILYFGCAS